MTPREKAEKLIDRMEEAIGCFDLNVCKTNNLEKETRLTAKQCAIVAVNLRLECDTWVDPSLISKHPDKFYPEDTEEFWIEVKEELEKM